MREVVVGQFVAVQGFGLGFQLRVANIVQHINRGRAVGRPQSRIGEMRSLVERVMGIEPTFSAWEADVLPLNYTRSAIDVPGDFHHELRCDYSAGPCTPLSGPALQKFRTLLLK